MYNMFSFGFMGFFTYVLLFVAVGGNSSRALHLMSAIAEYWLDTSVAALQALPLI